MFDGTEKLLIMEIKTLGLLPLFTTTDNISKNMVQGEYIFTF